VPWVPIKGALKKQRVARKLDRRELAKKAGLRERTIRLHESAKAPATMQADTVKRLALALQIERELFARWVDQALPEVIDDDQNDPSLPPVGTLGERARREREMGKAAALETPSGQYELLGAARLKQCMTACALYKDQRFAVAGKVDNHESLPDPAAKVLDVEIGVGARFMLVRKIAKGLPLYATVFTREIDHTRRLIDCAEAGDKITVISRVVVAPPKDDWKGFFIFEKPPKPRPFAFVVEEIVDGS
jgi:hypothetical protein